MAESDNEPANVGRMRQQAAFSGTNEPILLVSKDPEVAAILSKLHVVRTYPDTVDGDGKWRSTFKIEVAPEAVITVALKALYLLGVVTMLVVSGAGLLHDLREDPPQTAFELLCDVLGFLLVSALGPFLWVLYFWRRVRRARRA